MACTVLDCLLKMQEVLILTYYNILDTNHLCVTATPVE